VKCTSALLHCTSLINEPPIVDALLPNDSAVEPESATEQAETSAGPTVLLQTDILILRSKYYI